MVKIEILPKKANFKRDINIKVNSHQLMIKDTDSG